MQKIEIENIASIISFGHLCQRKLTDLNKCVYKVSQTENYAEVARLISELRSLTDNLEGNLSYENELYLNGIHDRIIECHRSFLMQGKTYEQLAIVNEDYIKDLEKHIEYAKHMQEKKLPLYTESVLTKRIHELELSLTVARDFTAQIKLLEKNSLTMASKLQSSLMTILPLLNTNLIFEGNRDSMRKAKSFIKKAINNRDLIRGT